MNDSKKLKSNFRRAFCALPIQFSFLFAKPLKAMPHCCPCKNKLTSLLTNSTRVTIAFANCLIYAERSYYNRHRLVGCRSSPHTIGCSTFYRMYNRYSIAEKYLIDSLRINFRFAMRTRLDRSYHHSMSFERWWWFDRFWATLLISWSRVKTGIMQQYHLFCRRWWRYYWISNNKM
jgi:hypothetical protein